MQRLRRYRRQHVDLCGGSRLVSAGLGLALAFCAGREERLRRRAIGFCRALFALPPMLSALGFVCGAARMPAWTEPLLAVGWRFAWRSACVSFPLRPCALLRSWGSISPSLARAAGVHGVSLPRYLWRVALPLQRRAIVTAMLLVGLLATAEIGMVLLLTRRARKRCLCTSSKWSGTRPPRTPLGRCAVDLAATTVFLSATWFFTGGDEG